MFQHITLISLLHGALFYFPSCIIQKFDFFFLMPVLNSGESKKKRSVMLKDPVKNRNLIKTIYAEISFYNFDSQTRGNFLSHNHACSEPFIN